MHDEVSTAIYVCEATMRDYATGISKPSFARWLRDGESASPETFASKTVRLSQAKAQGSITKRRA
jgi:hypothetical protein